MLAYFNSRPQDGDTDVTVDPTGFHARSANASTSIGWPLFTASQRVAGPSELLVLYHGLSPAYFVPRHAAATDEQWEELCRFVSAQIAESRPPLERAFEPVMADGPQATT